MEEDSRIGTRLPEGRKRGEDHGSSVVVERWEVSKEYMKVLNSRRTAHLAQKKSLQAGADVAGDRI